jgi:rhomboid protease GluP
MYKKKKLIEIQEEEAWDELQLKTYLTPMNMGLIGVNIIIFVISHYIAKGIMEAGASEWTAIMIDQEYYRLFTAMFLHFDWNHVLSNMLVLFLVGSFVEHYIGSIRYLGCYLLCGLAGNMISFYLDIGNASVVWSAGASGAVYGIVGLLAIILIKTKGKMEGITGPGIYLFIIGSVFHSYQISGVDNVAHLGGLITGCILGLIIKNKEQKKMLH